VQYPPGSLHDSCSSTTVVQAAGSSWRAIQWSPSHCSVSVQKPEPLLQASGDEPPLLLLPPLLLPPLLLPPLLLPPLLLLPPAPL
jgi:hypothetical protein